MLGSLLGSLLCAAQASGAPTAGRATASPTDWRTSLMRASFPVLDLELGLLRARAIGDLELQVFGADAFFEFQGGAASVIAVVRALAIEQRHQLVLAGLEITDVEPLHAAFDQCRHFARRVQIVRHVVVVDLQRYRIEREEIPDIHRYE